MSRTCAAFTCALLLLLGACHRHNPAANALDADADAQARTAAKTLADLAAAEQAAAAPLPHPVATVTPRPRPQADKADVPADNAVPPPPDDIAAPGNTATPD